MTAATAIALITAILSSAPSIIADVEKLLAGVKDGSVPLPPIAPEVHEALDALHTRIMAAALADRVAG